MPLHALTGGQSTALPACPEPQQVVGLRKKKKSMETNFTDKCEVLGSVGKSQKKTPD